MLQKTFNYDFGGKKHILDQINIYQCMAELIQFVFKFYQKPPFISNIYCKNTNVLKTKC